jgi:hypothetical protein
MYMNDAPGEWRKVKEGEFASDVGIGLKVADIDGDGDLDVFVINMVAGDYSLSYSNNNAMYKNEGGGELKKVTDSVFVTDGGVSSSVEVADIDGDGDLDVLVANHEGENFIYVWEDCPAGSARLPSSASWCFDCPVYTMRARLGDGAPLSPVQSLYEPTCARSISLAVGRTTVVGTLENMN